MTLPFKCRALKLSYRFFFIAFFVFLWFILSCSTQYLHTQWCIITEVITESVKYKSAGMVYTSGSQTFSAGPPFEDNILILDHDGNADSNRSGGKKFQVIWVELLHGYLQYNCVSSNRASSGLLLIQPQLLQLITECSSRQCKSFLGH